MIARLFLLAAAASFSQPLLADWPAYQHDASRVGATDEPLAAPLAPRWVFASPTAPQLAWAGEGGRKFEDHVMINRVRFDEVFHTVIAGQRLYFGSSVDGRVICKDLVSGDEVWTFFTDGPVRLAPMIADGRLHVGSDDGYAYCLDAASGKLIWKLRAGPNDERILARGRMISRWPVRTGVLVDGGIAYFGAGVFPHETVFLLAVDAASGKVIWKNDAISQQDAGRNDLSPQGYLLASKDTLFVPSGRALAASFKRATGDYILKPEPGWRGDAGGQVGGTQAFLADDQIYAVAEHHILALDQEKQKSGFGWFQGRQMTLMGDLGFMADGKNITCIDRIQHAESTRERHKLEMAIYKLTGELRKHPALAEAKKLQKTEGDIRDAKKAADKLAADGKSGSPDHTAAAALQAKLQAELAAIAAKYEPLRAEYKAKQDELAKSKTDLGKFTTIGVKWALPSPHDSALIIAGGLLIAGGEGEVIGIEADTGKQVWSAKVDGEARGLAAASGHLAVSTTEGKIHVFADAASKLTELAKTNPAAAADVFPQDDLTARYAAAADEILKTTGINKGFCLVLGNEQGRLALELARKSELSVFAVDADAGKVAASRAALLKSSLYGSRITVDHLDLARLSYSSYFANLIVSDSLLLSGEAPGDPQDVAKRLKPIGGKICLGLPANAPADLQAKAAASASSWLAATKLGDEAAKIEKTGGWQVLARAALPGAGAWSHLYGNAGNTSSTDDRRIKGGLSVLWYGDPGPGKMVNRHDGAVGPVSVNGRMFAQGIDSVMAYDAYNGQFLWETKNPGAMRTGVFNAREPGNMVATDDYLFMLIADECVQFDAASGRIVRQIPVPGLDKKPNLQWGYIAVQDGLLFGTATERDTDAAEKVRRGQSASIATDTIFAFGIASGQMKWAHQGQHISHVSIAIGDGRVFFIDASLTPQQREEMLRQDKSQLAKLAGKERELAEERQKKADLRLAVGLDAKTGKPVWSKPVDVTDCSDVGIGGGSLTLIYHNGHIVLGGANANGHYWEQFIAGEFKRRRLVVLDANKGDVVWAKDANYRHRPIVIDNDIVAEPWSYDLYTGAQKMRAHPLTGEQTPWSFIRPGHHCGAISATPNMMFFRSKYTAFYNRYTDEGTEHFAGHRLGCWINTIPANGLVMIPEASAGCVCLFSIASTVVFEPRDQSMNWGVYHAEGAKTPVQHMALNFGAPGDRRDATGKLWLGFPRPASRAGIDFPLDLKPVLAKGVSKSDAWYSQNEDSVKITGAETPWVFTSGSRGLARFELPLLNEGQPSATYTVRLFFAALEGDKPGQRVFDVKLQDKTVLKGLDPVVRAAGARKAVVEEFRNIPVTSRLAVDLISAASATPETELPPTKQPILSGIEVVRSDGKEIREQIAGR